MQWKKIQLTNAHKEKLFQIPLFRDLPLNIKESLLDKLDFVIYAADKKRNSCYARYTLQQTICVIGRKTTHGYHWRIGERSDDWVYHRTTYLCHPSPFQFKQYVASYFYCFGRQAWYSMATKDSTFKVISQDPQVLHNFLCIAGNCNICTVSRLKPLSRKTVRERFIVYLFEHKKKDSLTVEIMHTQSQLAEYLNVSRPALSKEINKIIKEGLITMEGKKIEILNKMALEKYL